MKFKLGLVYLLMGLVWYSTAPSLGGGREMSIVRDFPSRLVIFLWCTIRVGLVFLLLQMYPQVYWSRGMLAGFLLLICLSGSVPGGKRGMTAGLAVSRLSFLTFSAGLVSLMMLLGEIGTKDSLNFLSLIESETTFGMKSKL